MPCVRKKSQVCAVVLVSLLTVVERPCSAQTGRSVQVAVNPSNGHIYHLITAADGVSGISWEDAEATANSLGGHLVTINNAEENAWVSSAFDNYYFLWIGLNDVRQAGTFVWSSGEPVTYTNWYRGEPNDSDGGENYTHIYNFGSGLWQWNDNKNVTEIGGVPVVGVAEVVPPIPNIKANGSETPVQIVSGAPLVVDISLTPGGAEGQQATWFVFATTTFGWYSYDLFEGWHPGVFPAHKGPLIDLVSYSVLDMTLPPGSYTFYFVLDTTANGMPEGQLFYDSVDVVVTQ